jgi:cellulose synthase (UDP-forming)
MMLPNRVGSLSDFADPRHRVAGPTPEEEAAPRKNALRLCILVAMVAAVFYFGWWLRDDRLRNPWLLLGLVLAASYVTLQVFAAWFIYLRMKRASPTPARPGLKVDVYIPVYDEAESLIEQGLQAALDLRYPHRTFLLDDSHDARHRGLAESVGAQYMARGTRVNAKSGNVNAAMSGNSGDFITVFDVDHIPEPGFLDDILGHFEDPNVGFVQSSVGFRNQNQNWVTRAMVEQASDAYGPASGGMFGCGAAPVWGSHCTFRRAALESIGGHSSGLAEDLHTSIRLHAAGWQSVFVPATNARGLVPEDLMSCYKQQFKWARGVFEILFTVYPTLFRRLSPAQNVAYMLRCSYYLIGPVFLIHSVLAAGVLMAGSEAVRSAFSQYLLTALPFGAAVVGVRRLALATWLGKATPAKDSWRGYFLSFLLWPVYNLALLLALLRARMPHIATPKIPDERPHLLLVVPQTLRGGARELGRDPFPARCGIHGRSARRLRRHNRDGARFGGGPGRRRQPVETGPGLAPGKRGKIGFVPWPLGATLGPRRVRTRSNLCHTSE